MAVPTFNEKEIARQTRRLNTAMQTTFGGSTYNQVQRRALRDALTPLRKSVQSKVAKRRGALSRSVKILIDSNRSQGVWQGRVGYVRSKAGTPKDKFVSIFQILAYEFGTGRGGRSKRRGQRAKADLTGTWDAGGGEQAFRKYSESLSSNFDQVILEIARKAGLKAQL